jgi:DNA-binding response OmpR family regulator
MVTGGSGQAMMDAAFAAGATDYMQKPFSISQLRARATTCLMRRRAS